MRRDRKIFPKDLFRWLIIFLVQFGPILGVVAGLLVGALFVVFWGASPTQFGIEMVHGAFGDLTKIGATLNRTTPLLIAGVGTAIAFRSGAFNIGQEGQFHIGALAGVIVGLGLARLNLLGGLFDLPLILLTSMVAGALYAGIAGLLFLKRGVHEVLSTLLLNYVGTLFTAFMVSGPIRDQVGLSVGFPQSPEMPPSQQLPKWISLGSAHFGIVIGIFMALICAYLLWHTRLGFSLRMAGLSHGATRAAGYSPEFSFLFGLLVSGALSGLAGAVEVTGVYNKLLYGFGTGLGFDALAVALLANSNPIVVIPAALFFGALRTGSMSMQRGMGVPSVLLDFIRGTIILFVLGGLALSRSKTAQKYIRSIEREAAKPVPETIETM